MNNVILIGRLVKKPELEYTASGTAVTKFTLAVDRAKKGEADFIRVTAYDKQAENICRYMGKGRQIAISGRIQTGSYEKEGRTVYTTDIISDRSEFIGRANDSEPKPEKHNDDYRYYREDIF